MENESSQGRLRVRPSWNVSTTTRPFYTFDEAAGALLRSPAVEGATITFFLGGRVEFRRGADFVASINVRRPPLEVEVCDWAVENFHPDGGIINIQTVRDMAERAAAHFGLQIGYESDWFELRRCIGESLRGTGVEIQGWGDYLTANSTGRFSSSGGVIGRGGGSEQDAESNPLEMLREVIGGLSTVQEVQAALSTTTRLCRARIEEIVSALDEGVQQTDGSKAH